MGNNLAPFDSIVYNKNMKLEELIKLQNKWVAFSKDRKKVVGKASSLEDLLKKIKNEKDLIVSFMHPADKFLSP